jgi:hypothetical protein
VVPFVRPQQAAHVRTSPIYSFAGDGNSAIGITSYGNDLSILGSNDINFQFKIRTGTTWSLDGYTTGGAIEATPSILSKSDGDPVYSFVQNTLGGLSCNSSGEPILKNNGVICTAKSTGLYFDKPTRNVIGTSTSTSSISVDASTYQVFYWTATFGGSGLTLSIDNLAAGNSIEVWCMNQDAATEPALTVQASSSTSGHVSVKMCNGNGIPNSTTGLSLPGASTFTVFIVKNINSNFVGFEH